MFSQSILSHLHELRDRAIKSLIAFIVCTLIAWNFLDPVISYIVRPVGRIIFTSPEEAFGARMALAMTGGFLLALPVILFHLWKFIALGLIDQEKKYVRIFGPLSLVFFFAGSAFGYVVMVPMSLNFLLSFSSTWMVPMITVNKYISFVGTLVIASGTTFELPLMLAFLARIGIANSEFLRQKRQYAYIIILIVAAILTPPDIVSQIILTIPLVFLYELGIIFSQWGEKKR